VTPDLVLACPACHMPLVLAGESTLLCPHDGARYTRQDDIWRMLLLERSAYYQRFVLEYETVRQAEGRGSSDPAYYRSLPYPNCSGQAASDWRIRSTSYEALLRHAIVPAEDCGRRLRIVDVGAGNGWLSYRLAGRGHALAAVDLTVNGFDGLGAHVHYDHPFTPLQAEFDHLPFANGSLDLVIFNASFHYSTDYAVTLAEVRRVLADGGRVAIMDSPLYHAASSGAQMVAEREALYRRRYGFASNSLPSENYLTDERVKALSATLGWRWTMIEPWYGWGWALRPLKERLAGHRQPARFVLLLGQL
jgi:SAM-dependent methyltransferase